MTNSSFLSLQSMRNEEADNLEYHVATLNATFRLTAHPYQTRRLFTLISLSHLDLNGPINYKIRGGLLFHDSEAKVHKGPFFKASDKSWCARMKDVSIIP